MSIPHDCWGKWVDTVLRKYLMDFVAWHAQHRGALTVTRGDVETYLRECYRKGRRA